jgi:RNA polymerase sigma-70 factor, ECF subfamily
MDPREEGRWLARAKAGDRQAFESLLKPHLPMLAAYCRTICGDFHAGMDAVQETALIAYRKLHLYFGEADFATWLKAIARREALSVRRKRVPSIPLVGERLLEIAFDDPSPDALEDHKDALKKCLEELDRRDARSAEVLRSHYYQGSPLGGISAETGINLNTVKTLLHRARLALEACVERRLRAEGAV